MNVSIDDALILTSGELIALTAALPPEAKAGVLAQAAATGSCDPGELHRFLDLDCRLLATDQVVEEIVDRALTRLAPLMETADA